MKNPRFSWIVPAIILANCIFLERVNILGVDEGTAEGHLIWCFCSHKPHQEARNSIHGET